MKLTFEQISSIVCVHLPEPPCSITHSKAKELGVSDTLATKTILWASVSQIVKGISLIHTRAYCSKESSSLVVIVMTRVHKRQRRFCQRLGYLLVGELSGPRYHGYGWHLTRDSVATSLDNSVSSLFLHWYLNATILLLTVLKLGILRIFFKIISPWKSFLL